VDKKDIELVSRAVAEATSGLIPDDQAASITGRIVSQLVQSGVVRDADDDVVTVGDGHAMRRLRVVGRDGAALRCESLDGNKISFIFAESVKEQGKLVRILAALEAVSP